MKIAIVVGHHAKSRGAVATSGAQEYDVNLVLGRQIVAGLQCGRLFEHVPAAHGATVLDATVKAIKAWGADAVVEIHWNAVTDSKGIPQPRSFFWAASYAIVREYSGKVRPHDRSLGLALAKACADALGTKDMGIATRTSGYPMLRDVDAPAALLETHNGLDDDSHRAFLDAVADGSLAFSIARALGGWSA